MKNITIYKLTEESNKEFTFDKDLIERNQWSQLTDLQQEKVGFVPVYEDVLVVDNIDNYIIMKIKHSKRDNIKPETLEREFQTRMRKLSREEIAFDMDQLLSEVHDDLTRMSNIKDKEYLVVYDIVNEQFLFDSVRNTAEDGVKLIRGLLPDDISVELYQKEAFILQNLLTSWVMDNKLIPDSIVLGEKINLGKKTEAGKAASSANIKITKEHAEAKEVLNHIVNNKVVHLINLDWDGIIYFDIDHTFKITGVKYEEQLDYEESVELDEEGNFIAEWQLKLNELSKLLNVLYSEIETKEKLLEE